MNYVVTNSFVTTLRTQIGTKLGSLVYKCVTVTGLLLLAIFVILTSSCHSPSCFLTVGQSFLVNRFSQMYAKNANEALSY